MAKVVGEVAIEVGADVGPLVRAMDRGKSAVGAFGAASKRVGRNLEAFGEKAAGLGARMSIVSGAIAAAATAAFGLAASAADAGDAVAKAARSAGVSGDYYQEMAYAIGQVTDVTDEEFSAALTKLTKNLGEAQTGSKSAVAAFEAIGISAKDIASGAVTSEAAMDALIQTLSDTTDPALAAAIAADLLGKTGARIGGQLAGAGAEISSLRADAQRLGIVMGEDALNASEKFGDQVSTLKDSFEGLKIKLANEILPILVDKLLPAIQEKVIPALSALVDWVGDVIQWFTDLPAPVQEAVGVIAGLFAAGGPLLFGIGVFSKTLGAIIAGTGPIGLFIAAAGIAAVAWATWGDQIKAAVGGAVDYISGKFDAFVAKLKSIIEWAGKVKEAVTSAFRVQPFDPANVAPDPLANTPQGGGMINGGGDYPIDGGGGGSDMFGVGANSANGMLDGFAAAMVARQAELDAQINAIPNRARELLQIKSPSVVFHGIGMNIGEGLANGLAESQAMISNAMGALTGGAVAQTENMATGVLSAMGSLFQGSKKISAGIALANSWLAFTEVLKDPAFVGRPWARIAAAGQALAAGLNAVKNIKSATSGGGGSGGAGAGSGGGQAAPAPANAYITWNGAASVEQFQSLTQRLNSEFAQGYRLNIMPGGRA